MTKDSKIAFAILGFVICLFIGWAVPLLWLLLIAAIIAMVMTPNKNNKHQPSVQPAALVEVELDTSGIHAQIQGMINSETDEKVKEGLSRALAVVASSSKQQEYEAPMPTFAPQPAMTKAEADELKQRQELRNINTILYIASFLLVGAAALFIGFNDQAGPTLKFITLVLAAGLFYGTGLTMHNRSVRLIPAATAFIGTGLALIPFVGLAFNSYVYDNPSFSWFLTSVVGLVAFLVAVQRTRSNVMAYLSLGFLFSLATSTMSVLDTPFVWYFVGIIVTSSLLTYVSYKRPGNVPEYFVQPLELNANIAAPVVLIGSLLMSGQFNAFEYSLISGTGALHYLVMTLVAPANLRFVNWSVARALLIVFAATLTYHFTNSAEWVSGMVLVSGLLTHLYSMTKRAAEPRESLWLWVAQGLIVASIVGWYDNPTAVSATLALLFGVSMWQLFGMWRVEYAVAAVFASVILPLTLLRGVVDPAVGYEYIALLTLTVGAGLLLLRWVSVRRHISFKQAASLFYVSFIVESIILAAQSGQWVIFGAVMAVAGLLIHIASFIEKEETLVIGSNIMLLVGVFTLYGELLNSYTWVPIATGLTLGAGWYGLSMYHRHRLPYTPNDRIRSIILSVSAISVLVLGAFIAMFQTDETIVAGALLGCAAAGVVAYEAFIRKRIVGYEIAVYLATFCLQRIFAHVSPDADWLIYTHWWAITGGFVAWLYYRRTQDRESATRRAVLSLSALSIPTALAALFDSDGPYRTIFLLEHVVLAVAGLQLNKKIAVIWGSVGVGLAVLYMLRGYTYILLTLVAVLLIVLAVWRLSKKG